MRPCPCVGYDHVQLTQISRGQAFMCLARPTARSCSRPPSRWSLEMGSVAYSGAISGLITEVWPCWHQTSYISWIRKVAALNDGSWSYLECLGSGQFLVASRWEQYPNSSLSGTCSSRSIFVDSMYRFEWIWTANKSSFVRSAYLSFFNGGPFGRCMFQFGSAKPP